jgi:hypothetical protein
MHSVTVMHLEEPEWSNADVSRKTSPWIPLDRGTTVFTYRAAARKAHWDGYIVLRKVGTKLETEEAISGEVELDSGHMERMAMTVFTAWKDGLLTQNITREYQPITHDRLKQFGIDELP